jgi:N-acetylneuraminic acid mutarotase
MRYSALYRAHRILTMSVWSAAILVLLAACEQEAPLEPKVQAAPSPAMTALTNSWRTRAPMPLPLVFTTAAVVPNSSGVPIAYVVGGFSYARFAEQASTYAYNPNTNTWATRASMPVALRQTNGAVTINGKLYVSGGFAPTELSNALLVYKPATNTWETRAPMPMRSRSGVSAAIGGKLYVLIGSCPVDCPGNHVSEFVQQLWRYNPATNEWRRLKGSPRKHVYGVGGVINGKWYVAGGHLNRALDVYDPATNTWAQKASMPFTHDAGGAAVLGQKLYVVGGNGSAAGTVHAYDPATNIWTAKAPMLTPRGFLTAVKVVRNGNAVLLAMGGQSASVTELATNEEYDD